MGIDRIRLTFWQHSMQSPLGVCMPRCATAWSKAAAGLSAVSYLTDGWTGADASFDPVYGTDPADSSLLRAYSRARGLPVIAYVGFFGDLPSIMEGSHSGALLSRTGMDGPVIREICPGDHTRLRKFMLNRFWLKRMVSSARNLVVHGSLAAFRKPDSVIFPPIAGAFNFYWPDRRGDCEAGNAGLVRWTGGSGHSN